MVYSIGIINIGHYYQQYTQYWLILLGYYHLYVKHDIVDKYQNMSIFETLVLNSF